MATSEINHKFRKTLETQVSNLWKLIKIIKNEKSLTIKDVIASFEA